MQMTTQFELPSNFSNTEAPKTFDSPYSIQPSDNAIQGKITRGTLINTFKAPKLNEGMENPMETAYVYNNRLEQKPEDGNKQAMIVNAQEGYAGMPGFVDSDLVSEAFTLDSSAQTVIIVIVIVAVVAVAGYFGFMWFKKRKAAAPAQTFAAPVEASAPAPEPEPVATPAEAAVDSDEVF